MQEDEPEWLQLLRVSSAILSVRLSDSRTMIRVQKKEDEEEEEEDEDKHNEDEDEDKVCATASFNTKREHETPSTGSPRNANKARRTDGSSG